MALAKAASKNASLVLNATQVIATPLSPEEMRTTQLVSYIQDKHSECETAYKTMVARAKELYPAIVELEQRYQKQPGQRNDLDDYEFPKLGWHDYLRLIGVNPSTFRSWKARVEKRMQNLLNVSEEAVPGNSAPVFIEDIGEDTDSQVSPSEATQGRLEREFQAPDEEAEVTPDTKTVETSQPSAGATYTREQATSDVEMRQTTELVGKHVWLARSPDAFVLVLAFDKATAVEIASLNGVVPVCCNNVDLAETAVIMQGVIEDRRGLRFLMKEPSEPEETAAKRPANGVTTLAQFVKAA